MSTYDYNYIFNSCKYDENIDNQVITMYGNKSTYSVCLIFKFDIFDIFQPFGLIFNGMLQSMLTVACFVTWQAVHCVTWYVIIHGILQAFFITMLHEKIQNLEIFENQGKQ